jgi:hypothetical protein
MPGRPLNEIELEAYDMIPPELGRRVRVHRIPAIPGGYAGMTLGHHILLARDVEPDGTSTLLAHELVHVRQWSEQGLLGFSSRYLASFGRNLGRHRRWQPAYRDVDAEHEARRETTDWLRRRARRAVEEAAGAPDDAPADTGDDHSTGTSAEGPNQ